MNILFIAYNFTPYFGGVQRVTDILAKEFQYQGIKVFYLCGCDQSHGENKDLAAPIFFMDKPMHEKLDQKSVDLYHKYLYDLDINVVIHQFPMLERSIFFLRNTPDHIIKISTVHIQPFYYVGHEKELIRNFTGTGLKALLKKKILYLKPNLFTKYQLSKEIPLYKSILKYSDRLCLLSEKFIPRMLNICPEFDSSKIVAIGNPNTFRLQKSMPKDKLILYVGRVALATKNICDFVDVWCNLYQANPQWKACIVGDGPDMPYLREYISLRKVERLTLAGAQSDVLSYYQKANFICMVSTYEGWGMTLTEGMTCGCIPCAYNSYESLTDIIDDGINGIVVSDMNPRIMSNRIQQIIDSSDRMDLMSNNARRKVMLFSSENTANKWLEVINNIRKKNGKC